MVYSGDVYFTRKIHLIQDINQRNVRIYCHTDLYKRSYQIIID